MCSLLFKLGIATKADKEKAVSSEYQRQRSKLQRSKLQRQRSKLAAVVISAKVRIVRDNFLCK